MFKQVAVGPEAGWDDPYELELLGKHGFQGVMYNTTQYDIYSLTRYYHRLKTCTHTRTNTHAHNTGVARQAHPAHRRSLDVAPRSRARSPPHGRPTVFMNNAMWKYIFQELIGC